MRGIASIAGAALCVLALAGVAAADTIRYEGAAFTQHYPASISFKVKTNDRGKAKEVKAFSFDGLQVIPESCTYLDTGMACRGGDDPPFAEPACGEVVSTSYGSYITIVRGAIPGKMKLTKVPGEESLSISAEHFDPVTNTTLSVSLHVAKDGKKAGVLRLESGRWVDRPGPETGRPTRFRCEGIGLFDPKATQAPKSG
jgi:hypothetical protein